MNVVTFYVVAMGLHVASFFEPFDFQKCCLFALVEVAHLGETLVCSVDNGPYLRPLHVSTHQWPPNQRRTLSQVADSVARQ